MTHPRSFELEAFACGDGEGRTLVERHLAECAHCRAYVARVSALTAPPMRALPSSRPRTTRAPFLALMAASFTLAAAAALFFQYRTRHDTFSQTSDLPTAHTTTPASESFPSEATARAETAFKGGVQLALVRERHGVQERLTGTARVRPGDKLRFEIALDHPESVIAGVLQDDGSFVAVLDDATRRAGTHYSDRALGVDGTPTNGYAVAGPRAAVEAARTHRDLTGVASIRITWEALP